MEGRTPDRAAQGAEGGEEGSRTGQAAYVPTAYTDQRWERLGDRVDEDGFVPMALEVLRSDEAGPVDPMFADYGGLSDRSQAVRWHLPADAADAYLKDAAEEEAPAPAAVSLTADELESVREEAYRSGEAAGRAEALAEETRRAEAVAAGVRSVLGDLETRLAAEAERIEASAVSLALEVAGRLVGHAVEMNPEYVTEVIKEGLALSAGAVIQRVRVSPQDLEFLTVVGVPKELKGFDGTWSFEADDAVVSGCLIDTAAGEIDLRLDETFRRIRDDVMKSVRS